MAAFGVPVAHEDDPERAVRAALAIVETWPSWGSACGSASSRARSSPTRPTRRSRPDGPSTLRHACSRLPSRRGAARAGGGAAHRDTRRRDPGGAARPRGFPDGVEAWLLSRSPTGRPPARRLGAVRRAGGGARAAAQHVRACRPRSAGPPCHDLRGSGGRQVETRAGVHRRVERRPCCAAAACRTARAYLLGARGDGEVRGRDHRRRFDRGGCREAASLVWPRCRLRPAGAGLGRARRGRRGTVGHRRSAGRRGSGQPSWPTSSRSCSSSRTFTGRRSRCSTRRASRERCSGRGAPDRLPRSRRPARRAARPGAVARCDRARSSSRRCPRTTASSSSMRSVVREPFVLTAEQRAAVLETTEGNPLFIEETVRMLLESDNTASGYPAHRAGDDRGADRPAAGRRERPCSGARRRRADVLVGRGRGDRQTPTRRGPSGRPRRRDFLVREPRSTIRGEEAYRFKHVLIRDVAYAGLSKSSRALLTGRWRPGSQAAAVADELVEIRAYHLDEAAELEEELEGRVAGRARRRCRRSARAGRAAGRSRARRIAAAPTCSCAPSSSSRRSSGATWRHARPGG